MRPNAAMVTTAQQALQWHDEHLDARELTDAWMLRFARTIHADKRFSTIQRVANWFTANDDYRETSGFFATSDTPTPERVAWDMLGGDAGRDWAASQLQLDVDGEEASTVEVLLELDADERERVKRAALKERSLPEGTEVTVADDASWTAISPPPVEFTYQDGSTMIVTTTLTASSTTGDILVAEPGTRPMNAEDWADPTVFAEFEGRRPEWEGTLAMEGVPTSDNRIIVEGGLGWRALPLTLRDQIASQPGHDGAVAAGPITNIFREGQEIRGEGFFDSGEEGQNARRRMAEGTKQGVSVDLTEVEINLPDNPEDIIDILFGDGILEILSAIIGAATLVSIPAFEGARLQITGSMESVDSEALVASGGKLPKDLKLTVITPIEFGRRHGTIIDEVALVASDSSLQPLPVQWWAVDEIPEGAQPTDDKLGLYEIERNSEEPEAVVASGKKESEPMPPAAWFDEQSYDHPTAFTVEKKNAAGLYRVHGHLALWGSCHIAFTDRCVDVPRGLDYDSFQGPDVPNEVLCSNGAVLKAGPVVFNANHADLGMSAQEAIDHYAHSGCTVGQGRCYEDEHGLQIQGWLLPDVPAVQVPRIRATDFSPDWRGRATAKRGRGVVGVLDVSIGGFNTGLVASGGPVVDEEMAVIGTNWTPHLAARAQRQKVALERFGLPVPARIERAAVMVEDPGLTERKARVYARFSGCTDTVCRCGGTCG